MAPRLMKLVVTASTTTEIAPALTKFFYVTTTEIAPDTLLSIDAADFFDDVGEPVTTLPVLDENNGYFNVYINGVLQMQVMSTYVPGATGDGSLDIEVPDGDDSILANTPIVLEIVNFVPDSTTTVAT